MNWFSTIIRMAGTQFPWASALVQLQSELDSDKLAKRVQKLEDPISFLHEDVPTVSGLIYHEMKSRDSAVLKFDDDFYTRHSRSLAALNSKGYIDLRRALGKQLPIGVDVLDCGYTMYLCVLFEESEKMDMLLQKLEKCKISVWLDGKGLSKEIGLPLPVVTAVFAVYEGKGFGFCSHEAGRPSYCGKA